jgi:hypothetical protein
MVAPAGSASRSSSTRRPTPARSTTSSTSSSTSKSQSSGSAQQAKTQADTKVAERQAATAQTQNDTRTQNKAAERAAFDALFGESTGKTGGAANAPKAGIREAQQSQQQQQKQTEQSQGELKRLEDHIEKNFQTREQGDQKVVDLENNGRDDKISVDLKDPKGEHSYEVDVNGEKFNLNQDQMGQFADKYDLGKPGEGDSVDFKYGGQNVNDLKDGGTGPARMYGFAERMMGNDPGQAAQGKRGEAWNQVDKSLPPDSTSGPVSDPQGPLKEIQKNTAKVGPASGTVIQMPNGELGVATGQHVVQSQPGQLPKQVTVNIGGKEYQANVHAPKTLGKNNLGNPNDVAVLTLSPKDQADLRARGINGIPVTDKPAGQHERVISAGFPAHGGGDMHLGQGRVFKPEGVGPSGGTEANVEQYNGNQYLMNKYPQGTYTTSTSVAPGHSGGGLFALNDQGQPVLIGVHGTTDMGSVGGAQAPVGAHPSVDQDKINLWLSQY